MTQSSSQEAHIQSAHELGTIEHNLVNMIGRQVLSLQPGMIESADGTRLSVDQVHDESVEMFLHRQDADGGTRRLRINASFDETDVAYLSVVRSVVKPMTLWRPDYAQTDTYSTHETLSWDKISLMALSLGAVRKAHALQRSTK